MGKGTSPMSGGSTSGGKGINSVFDQLKYDKNGNITRDVLEDAAKKINDNTSYGDVFMFESKDGNVSLYKKEGNDSFSLIGPLGRFGDTKFDSVDMAKTIGALNDKGKWSHKKFDGEVLFTDSRNRRRHALKVDKKPSNVGDNHFLGIFGNREIYSASPGAFTGDFDYIAVKRKKK